MTRLNASNSKKSRGNSNSQEFFASQNMRLFSKNVRLLFAAIFRGLQTTSAVLCLDAHTKKRSLSAPFYMCLKQMVILGDRHLKPPDLWEGYCLPSGEDHKFGFPY